MDTITALREAAGKLRTRPFLIEEKRTLSYRDVDRQSNSLASGLGRLGVGKGDRVALYMNGASEFVISRFGVQKLGAMIVPLNTRLSAAEKEGAGAARP